jgi:pre-rRNA-processing protein TSR3
MGVAHRMGNGYLRLMPLDFEILMDRHENPRKCTILPQRERSDFKIRYFGGPNPVPAFQADCLLHIEGEDLSAVEKGSYKSVALIDCNWKKVAGALKKVERPLPRLVRIPEGFETAYPRRNAEGKDPEGGLATIEALFIAAAFLGTWDESILDKYHFKNDFLARNESRWKQFRLGPQDAS